MRHITFTLLPILIMFQSCGISENDYNTLKFENDSLVHILKGLEQELDEIRNGEERIIGLIERAYESGNYIETKSCIELLLYKHPETAKKQYYTDLLAETKHKVAEEFALMEKQQKDSIRLANINNLGIWEIKYFVDDFGEPTSNGYITNKNPIYGVFSNTATHDSKLRVHFIISNKQAISIKLFEYNGNNPVKGYNDHYKVLVQDGDGERYSLFAVNLNSDRLTFINFARDEKSYSEKMFDILVNGGEIKFKIIDTKNPTTEYNFVIPAADWFENAYTKLINQQR